MGHQAQRPQQEAGPKAPGEGAQQVKPRALLLLQLPEQQGLLRQPIALRCAYVQRTLLPASGHKHSDLPLVTLIWNFNESMWCVYVHEQKKR